MLDRGSINQGEVCNNALVADLVAVKVIFCPIAIAEGLWNEGLACVIIERILEMTTLF